MSLIHRQYKRQALVSEVIELSVSDITMLVYAICGLNVILLVLYKCACEDESEKPVLV